MSSVFAVGINILESLLVAWQPISYWLYESGIELLI